MKGIDSLLARAGKSEETDGIEADMDADSLLTGEWMRVSCPNMTSGTMHVWRLDDTGASAYFIKMKGGASYATDMFKVDGSGNMTLQNNLTMTAGDLSLTAGELYGEINPTTNVGGSGLENGQEALWAVRPPTYHDWIDDFDKPSGVSNPAATTGTSHTYYLLHDSGTTSTFHPMYSKNLGVWRLKSALGGTVGGVTARHRLETVRLEPGKKYWFEARVKCMKMYKGAFFVGLTDAAKVMEGTEQPPTSATDWIGFSKLKNSLDWDYVLGTQTGDPASGSSTQSVTAGATNTWVRLGFYVETTGTTTSLPYIDGVVGTAPTEKDSTAGSSYPSSVAMSFAAGVSCPIGSGTSFLIDYVRITQER